MILLKTGFAAVLSDNYKYYGTVVNRITHLSLTPYDSVDDEFSQPVSTWDLVLVNWADAV
jgi:hypothetical protein